MSDYDEDLDDVYGDVYGDNYEDVDEDAEEAGGEGDELELDLDEDLYEDKSSPEGKLITSNRRTIPIMTRFEYARIVGALAELISHGMPLDPRVEEEIKRRGLVDSLDIAELVLEFKPSDGKPYEIPIVIRRPLESGDFEGWNPRELIRPDELGTGYM